MPTLNVAHYNRAHWRAADQDVRNALLANLNRLQIINVHTGQNGDIEFDVTPFINIPAGGGNSILTAALLLSQSALAQGTTVELHGHFNININQVTHVVSREIVSIAFKFTAAGAAQPAYLGWINRAAITTANALDRQINRNIWNGR